MLSAMCDRIDYKFHFHHDTLLFFISPENYRTLLYSKQRRRLHRAALSSSVEESTTTSGSFVPSYTPLSEPRGTAFPKTGVGALNLTPRGRTVAINMCIM